MTTIAHRLARVWRAAALLLLLPLCTNAATFSIFPLRVELSAGHRTDIITLKNVGDAPLRIQIRAMLWTVAEDGQWILTPSKDLIVTPELVEIAPAQQTQLRVGTLLDSGAAEGAYRLLMDELPNFDGPDGAHSEIRVLTQISFPVFLEPVRQTRSPLLLTAHLGSGTLVVGFGNGGVSRLDPQKVRLTLLDSGGRTIEQRDVTASYVLPGRSWFLNAKLPVNECIRAASVSVTWPDSGSTTLTQPISADAQACVGADSP